MMDTNQPKNEFDQPGGDSADVIESKLVELWQRLLEQESTDIDVTFFDLGGHSVKAIELECLISAEFQVEIPLSDVFKTMTIRQLAGCIREAKAKSAPIKRQPEQGIVRGEI